jgi:peptidoglycan/LPS O-acetylase OafA/YrhL
MTTTTAAARPQSDGTSLGYLPGLDGLRAISVIAVMLYHGDVKGWTGGFLGVEVFFVISGYLITSLLLAERRTTHTNNLRNFYLRRARRLLPALFLVIAACAAYSLLFLPDSVGRLRSDALASIFYFNNWWQIIGKQSYFAQAGRPPLLRHLWSLSIEEQFYFIWPSVFILCMRRRVKRVWMVVGALAGAVLSLVLMWALYQGPPHDPSFVYYSTFTRASGVLIGVALAFAWAPFRFRRRPARSAGLLLDVVGLIGLFELFRFFRHVNTFDAYIYRFGLLWVDLATAAVLAAIVFPRSHLNRLLGVKPLRWVGLRSYGIYLWHFPIFAITRPGLDVPMHGNVLLVFRFLITFVIAALSYRFVEQPIRHGALGRYWRQVRETSGPRKSLLVRRGVVVGATTALLVVVLAGGLAGAHGKTEALADIESQSTSQRANQDPNKPVISLPRSTTGTTGTTAAPPTTHPGTKPWQTTPTTLKPGVPPVLAIGDSVMLGSANALREHIPGIVVDAVVSRQFGNAINVLQAYRNAGVMAPVVVVHLGTNGAFTDAQFDQMMRIISPSRAVFLNARVPRSWEPLVNSRLAAGVARWPNATLINWHDLANRHDNYFVGDGFHPAVLGREFYANIVASAVD